MWRIKWEDLLRMKVGMTVEGKKGDELKQFSGG